jgi:hypothetical protein
MVFNPESSFFCACGDGDFAPFSDPDAPQMRFFWLLESGD